MTEFDLSLKFYLELDDSGSTTWFVDSRKSFIKYYYNDENIDLNKTPEKLNIFAVNLNFRETGWKKPFVMQIGRPEKCYNDFSAKVVFSTTK